MVQGVIIRGTTPIQEFTLTQPIELISDVRIIYGQKGKALFTKTLADCVIVDKKIQVPLLQEETLLLNPNKLLYVEIVIKLIDEQIIGSESPFAYRVINSMNTEVFD